MTNQRPKIEYTSCDYESLRSAMLELARERLPEWTDHSPNDFGVALVELFAAMLDANFYALDRVAGESYLETAQERRSVVNLLRLIGYELRPPLPAYAALTLAFPEPVDPPTNWTVSIGFGSRFSTTAKTTGTAIGFRYMRPDLTINVGQLPQQTIDGKPFRVFRTLPVVQVDSVVVGELLGSSDGSPRQRFPLAKKPLVDGTLTVKVGNMDWKQVDSLLTSGGDDTHYSVRRDENDVAWIEFGDGTRGKAPPRGSKNITASYCTGGGGKGNVPALAISEAVTQIVNPTGKPKVFNEKPGNRGTDAEPIAEAVVRAPRMYRSMGRAVTASDFETHALAFGAAKARAVAYGNRVDVLVAPAGGGVASDLFKDDLRAYLDSKRMLTTTVSISDPTYVPLTIEIDLKVEPYYYLDEVKARVKAAVNAIWTFDRVDFGATLYVSKIYEAIEAVEGVAGVAVKVFARGAEPNAVSGSLNFTPTELPYYEGLPESKLHATGGKP